MSGFTEQKLAVEEIVRDSGQECTLGGVVIDCYTGGPAESKYADPGGYAADITISVLVLAEDTATKPASKDTLIYGGVDYRVQTVINSPDGGWYNLLCTENTKGV